VAPGLVLKPDGRQSDTALAIQRGVARLLRDHNFVLLHEFTLASGRRADVIALGDKGQIWIIEIKSSPLDFYVDEKWPEYREYCDHFSFAIPPDMDQGLMPLEAGLIVADTYGAEIFREASNHPLHASRRKALTADFARTAALRLQMVWEAGFAVL
jgi:hypothetical protein